MRKWCAGPITNEADSLFSAKLVVPAAPLPGVLSVPIVTLGEDSQYQGAGGEQGAPNRGEQGALGSLGS